MASPDSGSQSLPTLPQMRSLGAIRTHQHHQHQQRRREAHSATASSSSSNPSTPGDVFATLPLPAAFDVHTTHQPSMRAFMLANANGRASIQEPTPLDSARTSHTHVNLALGEDDPTFHANANVNGAASHLHMSTLGVTSTTAELLDAGEHGNAAEMRADTSLLLASSAFSSAPLITSSPAPTSAFPPPTQDLSHSHSHEQQQQQQPSSEQAQQTPQPAEEQDSSQQQQVTPSTPTSAPQTPQVHITFLLMSGRRKAMAFDPDTTVGRVKELMWNSWPTDWQDEYPSSPSHLRMLYFGKMLLDEGTLTNMKFPVSITPPSVPTIVHISIRPSLPGESNDLGGGKNKKGSGTSPDAEAQEQDHGCSCCIIC